MKESNGITVPEEVLQVHGFAPPKKAEGTVRLIYANVNGINTRMSDNEKVERMKELHNELKIDVAAYCKHKINFKHKRNANGFNQLFKGGEAAIQSIAAHYVHKNVGKIQQGGTSLILFGHITQQLDPNKSGKDPTGLGRWSVMTLQGEGVRTRIICGYNPCGNNKTNRGTSYQQQKRFFVTTRQDLTCPRKKFQDNLIAQMTKWREEGDRLIVCIDANENIYGKSIG
jgi:exonuclease III